MPSHKVLGFLPVVMALVFGGSSCNSVPSSQQKTPQNFLTDLQASSPAEADSTILKESSEHPGVIVIFDSGLNTDMAVDLSGSINFSGIYGNLSGNHATAQGEVSDYLANTADYARAVQPIGVADGIEIYSDANGTTYSQDQATRDTDLQQSHLQEADLNTRAQAVAQNFQMSTTAATQLVMLADRVQTLSTQGTLTSEDRAAINQSALAVAGLTSGDVNLAIASVIQTGRTDQVDALMQKAAANLGISSGNLKDKLLPALGLNLGN